MDLVEVILHDSEIRLLKILPDVDDGDRLPRISEIFAETAQRHGLPPEDLAVAYMETDPLLRSRLGQAPLFPRKPGLKAWIMARLPGRRPMLEVLDPAKIRELDEATSDLCYGGLIRHMQAVTFNGEIDYARGRLSLIDFTLLVFRQIGRVWRAGRDVDTRIAILWCDATQSWWKTGPGDRTTIREEACRWRVKEAMLAGYQSRRIGTTKIEIVPDGRRWRVSAFMSALMHEEPLL